MSTKTAHCEPVTVGRALTSRLHNNPLRFGTSGELTGLTLQFYSKPLIPSLWPWRANLRPRVLEQ